MMKARVRVGTASLFKNNSPFLNVTRRVAFVLCPDEYADTLLDDSARPGRNYSLLIFKIIVIYILECSVGVWNSYTEDVSLHSSFEINKY